MSIGKSPESPESVKSLKPSDVEAAASLVALGMRPKLLPARDPVYADLVRRYGTDDRFKDLVNRVASGLGLVVLAVTKQSGAVLAATEDSLFEIKMDEYARRTVLQNRQVEKMLHGLAQLAVAALAFPRPDDLGNDSYVGRVSVEQVDGSVREACRLLDERARAAEQNNDPPSDAPELERVWRAYLRRPAVTATKDGRIAADTTRGIVSKALRFLADQGFLVAASGSGDEGTYRTTPRYQVQVRELAAQRTFGDLLELGVLPVTGGPGALASTGWETPPE